VSRESLEQAIPAGDRLLLDSSTLISYLNGNERSSPVAVLVLDECVKPGRNEAYVSMVTVMEVLVRPLRRGPDSFQTVLNFLTRFPHLTPLEVDMGVAHQAANLRAFAGFKPADALTIASGFMAGVGHLVTNDDRWLKLTNFPDQRISVCYLEWHLPFP
jgi:predicted nucleic acid-binding protein